MGHGPNGHTDPTTRRYLELQSLLGTIRQKFYGWKTNRSRGEVDYQGPATGMESELLLEGLKKSE